MKKGVILLSAIFSLSVLTYADGGRYIKDDVKKDVKQENQEIKEKSKQEILQQEIKQESKKENLLQETETQKSFNPLDTKIAINVRDVSFEYLFSILSDQAGIPIVIKDFESGMTGTAGGTTAGATGTTGGTAGTTGVSMTKIGLVSYFTTAKSLRAILDELSGLYDLTWQEKKGKIEVYRYETKVFQVRLPALEKEVDLTDDAYKISYKKKFFNNLESSLKGILKDAGSKLSINDLGYVLVRARPSEVRVIEETIKRINKDLSTTIPLRITIMAVRLKDDSQIGLNVMNFSIKSTNLGNGGMVSGSMNLGSKTNAFSLGLSTLSWSEILGLLSEKGDVKVLEDTTLRALNYQPIAYKPQVKQRILSNVQLTYVSSAVGTGTGTGTGTTVATPTITTQTEDIDSGSNMVIVPYTLNPDNPEEIVIDLYRTQKEIEALTNYEVNLAGYRNSIVLPTLKSTSNLQQTVMKKGEKLILLSSVLDQESINKTGIPFLNEIPVLGYLFGKEEKSKGKYQFVITISYE